jgi:hypothetical protein
MNHITCFVISAVCLVLAAACFRMNQPNRATIDRSLAHVSAEKLNVPERMWPSYNATYLNRFVSVAAAQPASSRKSALELYIHPTLLWIDVGFAVFCAGFAALFWLGLLKVLPDYPLIKYLMAFFISMSLLYGVADVAEDLWLAKVFTKGGEVTKAESWIACALTETKLVTLSLSGAGGLLFEILQLTFPRPGA